MLKTYFSTPLSKSTKDTESRIRNIFQGQRKRPAAIALALVAVVALLCGSVVAVRAKQSPAPPEDNREQEEKEAAAYAAQPKELSELPAFVYQGDNPYLAAVCDWIVNGEGTKYLQAEVTIPCPLIAEIDDSDPQDIQIWGFFNVNNYKAVGTTLLNVSGGAQPALLHLRSTKDGFEVYEVEAVEDGEGYGDSMRRIFGTVRMKKLDAVDSDALRTQYIADYVLQNNLPFTQYQDYGWDPVHIPGTPETPEAAQIIHVVSAMGYVFDYDLRELTYDVLWNNRLEELTGVGKLRGISVRFERYADKDAETVTAELEQQMERPRRTETVIGADSVHATLLRDGATRDEVIKDTYIIAIDESNTLAVTVRNTYYAFQGDPIVPEADAVLERTLETFRLTQ